jgi:hypothetical protein
MNVKLIVKAYLQDHGYDGLYYEDCGCFIDDLIPCGESCEYCKPGVKYKVIGWEGELVDGIGREKGEE